MANKFDNANRVGDARFGAANWVPRSGNAELVGRFAGVVSGERKGRISASEATKLTANALDDAIPRMNQIYKQIRDAATNGCFCVRITDWGDKRYAHFEHLRGLGFIITSLQGMDNVAVTWGSSEDGAENDEEKDMVVNEDVSSADV